MRWLLFLAVGACAATPEYDADAERAELLRRLRAAERQARLVADGRCYLIRDDALRAEIRGFTCALADAIERQRGDSGRELQWVTGDEAVISEPWLQRGLNVDDVMIEAYPGSDGAYYVVAFDLDREGTRSSHELRATAALDAAWMRLADAARAAAVPTDLFGPVGGEAIRGEKWFLGGGVPREPQPVDGPSGLAAPHPPR